MSGDDRNAPQVAALTLLRTFILALKKKREVISGFKLLLEYSKYSTVQ